jgi:hypothetical protein
VPSHRSGRSFRLPFPIPPKTRPGRGRSDLLPKRPGIRSAGETFQLVISQGDGTIRRPTAFRLPRPRASVMDLYRYFRRGRQRRGKRLCTLEPPCGDKIRLQLKLVLRRRRTRLLLHRRAVGGYPVIQRCYRYLSRPAPTACVHQGQCSGRRRKWTEMAAIRLAGYFDICHIPCGHSASFITVLEQRGRNVAASRQTSAP